MGYCNFPRSPGFNKKELEALGRAYKKILLLDRKEKAIIYKISSL